MNDLFSELQDFLWGHPHRRVVFTDGINDSIVLRIRDRIDDGPEFESETHISYQDGHSESRVKRAFKEFDVAIDAYKRSVVFEG